MPGVSTTGSSSLGTVLVVGRNRVPRPAAGTTADRKGAVVRGVVVGGVAGWGVAVMGTNLIRAGSVPV